tara:strand:- start:1398 stop:2267 length:870 start_codon:yes stop_codon:yes gene_type:complete
MATNQYFKNYNSVPQQNLIDSLSEEVIKMNGTDVLYLPRVIVKRDNILQEDTLSKFTKAYEVEMYLNNTDAFGGAGDQLTKFGLDVQDELIFTVNKERFKEEVAEIEIPREGDLIYLRMNRGLFEIRFVEHEKPFYSLGKNYVYEITCEKFVYSNEKFEIPAAQDGAIFDAIERDFVQTITLDVSAGVGEYKLGEQVYQGADLGTATARAFVSSFNISTNQLSVYNEIGTFKPADGNVIGNDSGTTRVLTAVDDQSSLNLPHSDNKDFETQGDDILDFSEIDPWAEGEL